MAGGKGKRKGKLLKQGSALARFEGWFGSMSLMNTLYVWFPASWGPSVVEAIKKRNETWLAQNPVHRDPQMFNATEVEMGPAAREMTYKIQKWNVVSERVHPILVANARVDWLALNDAEISRNFPILLEGILQDVFSQRASSAWQGAQPQRITVSLLLPGSSTAAQRRDFLQSRRQFWPTMTTRHASLAPLCAATLQRERRQMQSKHLWDKIDIHWLELSKKLYVLKPTGLTREQLWHHLFVLKHRQNPFQERRYKGDDEEEVKNRWNQAKEYFRAYQGMSCPFSINVEVAIGVSTLTTKPPRKQFVMPRLFMRVGGKPRKAPTESKSNYFRMFVIVEMSGMLLRQLNQSLSITFKPRMVIQIWMPDHYWLAGHSELVWLLGGARHMSALRMSHRFTRGSRVSPFSGTCRGFLALCCCVCFCFVCLLVVWFLFSPFCK